MEKKKKGSRTKTESRNLHYETDGDVNNVIFGTVFQTIRKGLGLTQDDISMMSGWTDATISRIETGRTSINLESLVLLALFLEMEPHELFAVFDESRRVIFNSVTSSQSFAELFNKSGLFGRQEKNLRLMSQMFKPMISEVVDRTVFLPLEDGTDCSKK